MDTMAKVLSAALGRAIEPLTDEQRREVVRFLEMHERDALIVQPWAALLAEREATIKDLEGVIGAYHGTSDGDGFARTVLEGAVTAVRVGQAARAGACNKPRPCGGGCSLPVGHEPPCSCTIDRSECPA